MNKKMRVAVSIFLALFIVIGAAWTVTNVSDYDTYRRMDGIAVPVQATITSWKEDRDDLTDVHLYISYEYGGVRCDDVFYKPGNKADVGRTVTIRVDPADPAKRMPKDPGMFVPVIACLFIVPAGFLFLLVLSHVLALGTAARRWQERYALGLISEALVREDLLYQRQQTRAWRIRLVAMALIAVVIGSAAYRVCAGTWTALMGFLPPVVIIAVIMIFWLRRREGEISLKLVSSRFMGQTCTMNDEGGRVKELVFEHVGKLNRGEYPLVSLTGKKWRECLQVGQRFWIAVMGLNEPVRFFPAEEFRMEEGSGI